ncbi:MAG TPA: hypothetical protein VE997_00295, partial [Candidatus Limnocylindria bacterium]|nr:hypothetical protein [Candidatus Limnocylindria bacterium]
IITIAGTGEDNYTTASPDGTPATLVPAGCPGALAVGGDGRVYYTDLIVVERIATSRIRVLTRTGF